MYVTADYNFTDNSVETLEKKLKECSLAMGFRQDSLSSKELVIHSVATKLSDYLNALRSIIPQQFLSSYHSPCWRSPIILSTKQRKGLKSIKEKNQKELDSLYKSISAPSLNPSKKSLMCLPAFFVAGFPKSGTTTLHTVLHGHKEIAVAKKEPHWWTRAPLVKGTNPNYLRLTTLYYIQRYYNLANSEVQEDHQLLIYDASQSTLWDSIFHVDNQDYCAMPIAVSHILPSAKFVVVMRNPVERIFSHYVSFCTGKNSQPPPSNVFHESVVANVNFFRKCVSKNHSVYECANDKQFTKPPITVGCGAVGYHLIIGMYYLHLKKWMQFYPRESFLFLRTDDMSSQPAIFMNNITDFLNINQFPENTSNMLTHRKNVQKLHMEMLPETRAILSEFYRPFNEMLVELTGDRRFHW